MLTYNDCLELSGLSPEQAAALARHEHLPEIVALGMGWSLCGTPEGRRRIRRMILDVIEGACRQGHAQDAATLGLALHRFLEAHSGRHGPAESPPQAGGAQAAAAWHDGLDHLMQALGLDLAAALRVREHVDAHLAEMLPRFGLDHASAWEDFPTEMQVAETCCAACAEPGRCHRFLAGMAGDETPSAFCPNAPLLAELGQCSHHPRNAGL